MMNTRERFQAVAAFRPFDRLPVLEWANWWNRTIERWREEGLPPDAGRYDICRYFDLDLYVQDWFRPRRESCPRAASHGAGILADEKEYEALRPHLFPSDVVNRPAWEERARMQGAGEAVLWFSLEGFFWFPRTLLGIERHLYAFYDQPELMHRINRDLAGWMLGVIDEVCSICTPDFMTFAEDMSYNHGPMLSEALFDEFLLPYYRQVVPELRRRGIRTVVDSDGDVTVAAHWFERAGIEGILPLERQAGVDIGRLRADHPRMLFMGHYDKMVMNRGEDAVRREFERVLPVAARGGYFVSCDHQTPPGVSLEAYRMYVRLFHEVAREAGRRSREACAAGEKG